jgi:hypothetical protein
MKPDEEDVELTQILSDAPTWSLFFDFYVYWISHCVVLRVQWDQFKVLYLLSRRYGLSLQSLLMAFQQTQVAEFVEEVNRKTWT